MQNLQIDIETEFVAIKDQLKSYLYRLSANKEDAEDLAHDSYIRVKEKIHTFKGNSSLKTWVFAIATNLAKDNQRVKNRWELEVQDHCKEAALANQHYQNRIISVFQNQPDKQFEISSHINYCFTCIAKNLDIEQQIVIILKEFYHFKRKEIAEIIGKTEGIIKHLLHDGRKELQMKYNQRCAMINKTGVCYQCAELNDFLQEKPDSELKIRRLGLSKEKDPKLNLNLRFQLINKINPLTGDAENLEDTILQILRETINDK